MIKKIIRIFAEFSIYIFCKIYPFFFDEKLIIITYHEVSEKPNEFSEKYHLNVTPEVFEKQIKFLSKNFNFISPERICSSDIPKRSVLITFDDGFENYFKNAVPILEKYNAPSLIFLNMAPIKGELFFSSLINYLCSKDMVFIEELEKTNAYDPSKPHFLSCRKDFVENYIKSQSSDYRELLKSYSGKFINSDKLNDYSDRKNIFFGNHLYSHPIPCLLNDEELISEYLDNHDLLKQFPNYINFFAFPFGQPVTSYKKRQIDVLHGAGAEIVFDSCGEIEVLSNKKGNGFFKRISLTQNDHTERKIYFRFLHKYLLKKIIKRHR